MIKLIQAIFIALTALTLAAAQFAAFAQSGATAPAEAAIPADVACSITKGTVCKGDGCKPATSLGEESLPVKFTLDFDNRLALAAVKRGYINASRITVIARDGEDKVLLHGMEHGFGWLMAMNEKTRAISLSLTGVEGSFIGFGECVPVDDLHVKKP